MGLLLEGGQVLETNGHRRRQVDHLLSCIGGRGEEGHLQTGVGYWVKQEVRIEAAPLPEGLLMLLGVKGEDQYIGVELFANG